MEQPDGVETLLSDAYALLTKRDLAGAQGLFDRALSADYDHPEVLYSLKCCAWWQDALERAASRKNAFEAGEHMLERWKAFTAFSARAVSPAERAAQAFRRFAFGYALDRYQAYAAETDGTDAELQLRLGIAHKGLGDFESATRCLEAAAKARKDDAAALAQLADVYDLVGDQRASKALFREAFLLNPQKVELETLESPIVARLKAQAEEAGRLGPEAAEWIPILGELSGVFSVKRELKPIEASKLRQSVYELETELSADASRRPFLVPRLINRYFWLIDHGLSRREDRAKVDELLRKIKLLDANVYSQYIA